MSTVIKATDRRRASQTVAFNFDDMAASAKAYLDQVRAEAAKIVADARQEAVRLKQQAEAEGRREGMSAVERIVQEQLGQQLTTLRPALERAVEEIRHAKQAWLHQWEKGAVHLAAAIAARILRRELDRTPEVTVTLVREALEIAAGNAQLKIRLNPADHAHLASQIQMVVRELAPLAETELIADPQVTAGGCRVETRFGVIDQQFESQIARIEEELV
jgi:flagellar assembly protein FliH